MSKSKAVAYIEPGIQCTSTSRLRKRRRRRRSSQQDVGERTLLSPLLFLTILLTSCGEIVTPHPRRGERVPRAPAGEHGTFGGGLFRGVEGGVGRGEVVAELVRRVASTCLFKLLTKIVLV